MPYVNCKEMLQKAKEGHYAIGHFNINNLEWTKAILEVAQELNSPVILGVSEGATKYMGGYHVVSNLVQSLIKDLNITIPAALHLDHGTYEGAKKAIEAGFSSVMFDGSHFEFDENINKTIEIVELAKKHGMSTEAEVGSIGGEEDGKSSKGEHANPKECKIISKLGIDMLAAGIGNIHGVYPSDWEGLDFDTLKKVNDITNNIPLVLHGGTGIPDDMVKKAITLGVAKVNVNTECQIEFTKEVRKYFENNKDKEKKGYDPRKVLKPGVEAIKNVVREKMKLFGSIDKA